MSWIKVVPVKETKEDKLYFLGRSYGANSYDFWSRYLNGREAWSVKPGIAIQVNGGPSLVKVFSKNPQIPLVAIEVPIDADKRWRRRRKICRS